MRTTARRPRKHATLGWLGGVLATVVFLLTACGERDKSPADADAAPATAFMRPVGDVSEVDATLFEAAGKGDSDGVEEAIEEGADVNAADKLKRTPLFGAAFLNRPGTAKLLITAGADVNARDFSDFTPLHAAVVAGGKEVAAILLANGANINDRAVGGRTALHLAAATNQAALVDLLLEKGANPNAKDSEGLRPAALAARNDHGAISARLKQWMEKRNAK